MGIFYFHNFGKISFVRIINGLNLSPDLLGKSITHEQFAIRFASGVTECLLAEAKSNSPLPVSEAMLASGVVSIVVSGIVSANCFPKVANLAKECFRAQYPDILAKDPGLLDEYYDKAYALLCYYQPLDIFGRLEAEIEDFLTCSEKDSACPSAAAVDNLIAFIVEAEFAWIDETPISKQLYAMVMEIVKEIGTSSAA